MPRARNDARLCKAVQARIVADLIRGLVAVHDGHGAVHEDEAVAVAVRLPFIPLLDQLQRLLSIEGLVDNVTDALNAHLAYLNCEAANIVRLVVDNEDALGEVLDRVVGEGVVVADERRRPRNKIP